MKAAKLMFLLLLMPVPLAGQTGGQEEHRALRDSLAGIRDVPLLFRMERGLPTPPMAPGVDAIARRGLTALRIWELTEDRADADRARETFETAVARFPGEVWSHYGLALALAHGPDVQLSVPGGVLDGVTVGQSVAEIFKRDPKSKARRSLREALTLAPGYRPAAVLLADLALADGGRSTDLIREARDALVAAVAASGPDGPSTRALADMEIALGNYGAAGEAVKNAEDAGALRAHAVALLLQPDAVERGARQYWLGVERLTDEAAEAYFADVEVLATPREAAEWREAGLAARRSWLTRFWERRAADGGVMVSDRLSEHYRRLTKARQRYVRNSIRGTDGAGVLLSGEAPDRFPFDDRGVLLIRHGEPLEVASTSNRAVHPNETWVYDLPGIGRQMFHFVALRGSQNYSLVSDLLRALDQTSTSDPIERNAGVVSLLADRAPFDSRYQAVLGRLRNLLREFPGEDLRGTEVRSMLEVPDNAYQRGARIALQTDSHERRFRQPLPFLHDVFTFRTPEGRTDLTAVFAVPAGMVGLATSPSLRVSVIAVDTLLNLVTRRDTTLAAQRSGRDMYVRTHLTMAALPSDNTVYRLVVEDTASGRGGIARGGTDVRDYSTSGMMISDIVLALPDSAGDWRRGSVGLALALPRTFSADRPFTVFYEIYNLPADRPYSTRVTVEQLGNTRFRRLLGGGGPRIDVRFGDVARVDGLGHIQESRQLATDLPVGRYRMTVLVTAGDGLSARRVTEFEVGGP